MSITDGLRRMLDQSKKGLDMESLERLRRYVNEHTNTDWEYATFPPQRQLVNCTDTAVYALIDAIENEVVNMRNLVWNEGYDMGFTSADKLAVDREDKLSEHGWLKLPKDADGEYIRIGDVMDSSVDYLFDGKPFTVRAIVFCEDGWEAADSRFGNRYEPDSLHHHYAPTVEDVLREFARVGIRIGSKDGIEAGKFTFYPDEDMVSEYASKLRLAGDAE